MPYAVAPDLDALVQGTVPEATAELLIELASSAVDQYVGKPLAEGTYTETFFPSGDRIWIAAPDWPVEVTNVNEDDVVLIVDDDYSLTASGALDRASGDWGSVVAITYTTGFATTSPEYNTARRIVLEMAARAAANPQHLDSITVDGQTPSFVTRDNNLSLPPLTMSELQKKDLAHLRWRRSMV